MNIAEAGVNGFGGVSAGHFFTNSTDWILGGILPLAFERVYYSYSAYHGPLGIGWHHTYDLI